jgi:hypothetical protein
MTWTIVPVSNPQLFISHRSSLLFLKSFHSTPVSYLFDIVIPIAFLAITKRLSQILLDDVIDCINHLFRAFHVRYPLGITNYPLYPWLNHMPLPCAISSLLNIFKRLYSSAWTLVTSSVRKFPILELLTVPITVTTCASRIGLQPLAQVAIFLYGHRLQILTEQSIVSGPHKTPIEWKTFNVIYPSISRGYFTQMMHTYSLSLISAFGQVRSKVQRFIFSTQQLDSLVDTLSSLCLLCNY